MGRAARWLHNLREMHVLSATGCVLVMKILSSGAAFAGVVWAGRALEPEGYGSLWKLRTVMFSLAGLVGPAFDAALVRYASRGLGRSEEEARYWSRSLLRVKLTVSVVLVGAGFILARPIHSLLFSEHGPGAWLVSLAFLGAGAMMALEGVRAWRQSREQFFHYSMIEFSHAALAALLVALLLVLGHRSITPVFWAYAAAPMIVAVVSWRALPAGSMAPASTPDTHGIFGFTAWMMLACACTCAADNLDAYLLGWHEIPDREAGDYGAARTLARVADLAVAALFSVLLPKASRMATTGELYSLMKRYALPSFALAIAASPLVLLSGTVVRFTFGDRFGSGGLLGAMCLGTLVAMAGAPAGAVLYALGHSRVIAIMESCKLAATFLMGGWAVSHFGASGMAWTLAGTRGTIGVLTWLAAWYLAGRTHLAEKEH